jgi:hypothetical protein
MVPTRESDLEYAEESGHLDMSELNDGRRRYSYGFDVRDKGSGSTACCHISSGSSPVQTRHHRFQPRSSRVFLQQPQVAQGSSSCLCSPMREASKLSFPSDVPPIRPVP